MMPPRTPHAMEAREIVMPPCVCVRGLGVVDAVGEYVSFDAVGEYVSVLFILLIPKCECIPP